MNWRILSASIDSATPRSRSWAWLPCAVLGLFHGLAHAASCSVAAVGVAFGTYDPLSVVSFDATGSVRVTCLWTSGSGLGAQRATPVISLSAGFPPGTFAQRRLRTSAGDLLSYNLYRNAARTQVWGDGSSNTFTASTSPASLTLPASGNPRTGSRTIYGRMPAGQVNAVPGAYTDTITVTVAF
jgi:spore coat protein U-like protein